MSRKNQRIYTAHLTMPEYPGVYLMTHNVTGDTYVGSSINIRARAYKHISWFGQGRCQNKLILRLLSEHGSDFSFSVLQRTTASKRFAAECRWFRKLKPTLCAQPPRLRRSS